MSDRSARDAAPLHRLRALTPADEPLLWRATELNVNWQEQRVDRAAIAADPALAHYCRLVPDRGDFGLVAEPGGRPLGVVWLLHLGAADPGYGFVQEGVPELSVCVWPNERGHGLGRALVEAALGEARSRGLSRVSLSVEAGNPAERLYRSLGFEPVPAALAGTFIAEL